MVKSLIINPGTTINPGVSLTSVFAPTGLTAQQASTSAWQIKQDHPGSVDGLYWIKNDNIAGGTPVQIYADMTTDGGGWTLLVQNTGNGWAYDPWTNQNILERNEFAPPSSLESYDTLSGGPDTTKNYSILGWANYIKKNASSGQATFDFMFDAGYRGRNGGIWTANENYSFVATYDNSSFGDYNLGGSGFRKNITEIEHFPGGAPGDTVTWNYNDNSIEGRMPYIGEIGGYFPGGNMLLGTNGSDGNWWGTIISWQQFNPAPWIGAAFDGLSTMSMSDPRVIWYWVR